MNSLLNEIKTWNQHLSRSSTMNPNLVRLATEYNNDDYFSNDSQFSISDFYSLTMLRLKARLQKQELGLSEFYDRSALALANGLEIKAPDFLFEEIFRFDSHKGNPEKKLIALEQLFRIRLHIIRFQDEWGQLFEGDLWGLARGERNTSGVAELPRSVHFSVSNVRKWYKTSADHLLSGLHQVDSAIDEVLGHRSQTKTILYRELRERFQYPDVSKFWDDFCIL